MARAVQRLCHGDTRPMARGMVAVGEGRVLLWQQPVSSDCMSSSMACRSGFIRDAPRGRRSVT